MTEETLKREDIAHALRLAFIRIHSAFSGIKDDYVAIAGKDAAQELHKILDYMDRCYKLSLLKENSHDQ